MQVNTENKKTYIYGLMDGDVIKYVGKSDNPDKRKKLHITESINGISNTDKCNWINKMISNDKEIGLKILEEVFHNEREEKEQFWIKYYGIDNLVNCTVGGLGNFDINGESNLKYNETMKRSKNLKITPITHKILKDYCEENGLKMFAFVEKIIKKSCIKPKDIYGDD